MTYHLSGQPTACHSMAMAEAFRDSQHRDLGINPQTGDYQIGDGSASGYHTLRLLAIGSLYAVDNCRDSLHKLGYAHPSEWSIPMPLAGNTGILRGLTPSDVLRILTKRIALPQR